MHVRRTLQELGYTANETLVYLTALGLGGSTATEIATKTKLPRTSVNLVIASLHKKGLMEAYLKRRSKIWVAANPNRLLVMLKENETALKIILPELQSLRQDAGVKPTVRTYLGAAEIRQIMHDIIETKRDILAIINWEDLSSLLDRKFVDDFTEMRCNHYLKMRLLTQKTRGSMVSKEKDSQEMRTTQFLPESIVINNSNFIYGDKVAIISFDKKEPVGILIEDDGIRHTMQVLFESLWKESTNFR